jgi:hypothetical protein
MLLVLLLGGHGCSCLKDRELFLSLFFHDRYQKYTYILMHDLVHFIQHKLSEQHVLVFKTDAPFEMHIMSDEKGILSLYVNGNKLFDKAYPFKVDAFSAFMEKVSDKQLAWAKKTAERLPKTVSKTHLKDLWLVGLMLLVRAFAKCDGATVCTMSYSGYTFHKTMTGAGKLMDLDAATLTNIYKHLSTSKKDLSRTCKELRTIYKDRALTPEEWIAYIKERYARLEVEGVAYREFVYRIGAAIQHPMKYSLEKIQGVMCLVEMATDHIFVFYPPEDKLAWIKNMLENGNKTDLNDLVHYTTSLMDTRVHRLLGSIMIHEYYYTTLEQKGHAGVMTEVDIVAVLYMQLEKHYGGIDIGKLGPDNAVTLFSVPYNYSTNRYATLRDIVNPFDEMCKKGQKGNGGLFSKSAAVVPEEKPVSVAKSIRSSRRKLDDIASYNKYTTIITDIKDSRVPVANKLTLLESVKTRIAKNVQLSRKNKKLLLLLADSHITYYTQQQASSLFTAPPSVRSRRLEEEASQELAALAAEMGSLPPIRSASRSSRKVVPSTSRA